MDELHHYKDYKELGLAGCANSFGIGKRTLPDARKSYNILEKNECRGSGNYSSEEEKEIAMLKRKLCDAKEVLDV